MWRPNSCRDGCNLKCKTRFFKSGTHTRAQLRKYDKTVKISSSCRWEETFDNPNFVLFCFIFMLNWRCRWNIFSQYPRKKIQPSANQTLLFLQQAASWHKCRVSHQLQWRRQFDFRKIVKNIVKTMDQKKRRRARPEWQHGDAEGPLTSKISAFRKPPRSHQTSWAEGRRCTTACTFITGGVAMKRHNRGREETTE